VKDFSDSGIQPLQQIREGFSFAPHEAGHERPLVDSDGCTFDGWHASDADVTAFLIQQRGDMQPQSFLLCVRHGVVSRPCIGVPQAAS
jgi:hypothetical protein